MGPRLVLLVALLLPLCARAVEPPVSPEAKRHVDLGVEAYNAGRFADAAKEFELAYRISARPALLFNIARAEAKLGHEEAAIAFLRRYLEERPNAPDAPAVLAEIEAHEKTLLEDQAKSKAETDAKEAEAQAARAQIEASEARHKVAEATDAAALVEKQRQAERDEAARRERSDRLSTLRKAGIALTVAGPVLLVVGIALGAGAAHIGDEVSGKSGQEWSDCCADLQQRGRTLTSAGIAFDVIGGAATAAGVALLIAGRNPNRAAQVWLAPRANGISVGGGW
jgi:tetratricopeptide (TPR) repeat protein